MHSENNFRMQGNVTLKVVELENTVYACLRGVSLNNFIFIVARLTMMNAHERVIRHCMKSQKRAGYNYYERVVR